MPTIEELRAQRDQAAAEKRAAKESKAKAKTAKQNAKQAAKDDNHNSADDRTVMNHIGGHWAGMLVTSEYVEGNKTKYTLSPDRITIKKRPDVNNMYGFTPNPAGSISIYGQRAKLLYDPLTRTVRPGFEDIRVWFYTTEGVMNYAAGDEQAIAKWILLNEGVVSG